MRSSILTDEQAAYLRQEKESLAAVQALLKKMDLPRERLDLLQKAILQLDELFLLVIVGEFNAGKSALINALLGEKVLKEGATPTTSRVTLVKWGDQAKEQIVDENFAVVTYPLELLDSLNIVDTPGTNAIIREHERLTEEYVPRSDLVLFVTSADRPLTESERQFLERILTWGKKVVLVLNKADIFEDQAALEEVRAFILTHATAILKETPEFFPVSARLAQRAGLESAAEISADLRSASRMDDLETYIHNTLDDSRRLRLKFNNPLGVADALVSQALEAVQAEQHTLKEDRETAAALEQVTVDFERELHAELAPRLAEVENILHRFEARGLDFFDNTMRLTKIGTLARGDQVRIQFEQQVLSDVPAQIEEQIQRMIDWLVQKDLREWQQVMNYLNRRQARYLEQIVGETGHAPDNRRRELLDSVGKTARTIVDTYDQNKEARELAANVEAAVAQTAMFEAGAVGLGALVTFVIASSTLDITGILAAGTLAIVGFFVIPYKRKQAKENFKEKMLTLRTTLLDALTEQFNHEAENAVSRIKDGIAPYTRFINAEQARLEQDVHALTDAQQQIGALQAQVDAVTAPAAENA